MAEDIKKLLEDHKEEIKRHFDVAAEATKSEIKIYTEQIGANTTKLTKIEQDVQDVKKDITRVKDDVSAIKTTLEAVNLFELKQELTDLKKRVAELEASQKR